MLLGWMLGAEAPLTAMAILALALALDALLGESLFRRVPHPVALIGRAVAALEARMNSRGLDEGALRLRGALAMAIIVGGAIALGLVLVRVLAAIPLSWLLEAVIVSALLAARSLYDHVRDVAAALERGGLAAGRTAVAHIVGRDPAALDQHGVSRAAIESLAENFSDGVVAPAFWYALFGLPGLLAYKAINTLDSMIGHKTPRYLHFGMVAARLDDWANLIPARLSGLLIVLAAGRRAEAAFNSMLSDARRHRSPNAGWPEAAMAGALGIRFGGPRAYDGEIVDLPWMGDGRSQLTRADIDAGLQLYHRTLWLLTGLLAVLAVAL